MPMPIGRKPVQYRGIGQKCEFLLLAGGRQRDKEGYQFVLKWLFFHRKSSNLRNAARNRLKSEKEAIPIFNVNTDDKKSIYYP